MTAYFVALAVLLRLVLQVLRHPFVYAKLVYAIVHLYGTNLRASAKERLRLRPWNLSELGPISCETNRRMALDAVFVAAKLFEAVNGRVKQLDLTNGEFVVGANTFGRATLSYVSAFEDWVQFSPAPERFGQAASQFSTALVDFLKRTPPRAILSFAETGGTSALVRIEASSTGHAGPPKVGEYLLRVFLSKRDREAIPGDLEEEFSLMVEKFGLGLARAWYWIQVVSSISAVNANRLGKLWRWLVAMALFRLFHR